jgi:hypothetical protein
VNDGVAHVQPPVELLEQMLAVRIHLDPIDATNGARPPRHAPPGPLESGANQLRQDLPEVTCNAAAGDALLMRPLLLHASSRATVDRPRRVLHIEYAGCNLPARLAWHAEVNQ